MNAVERFHSALAGGMPDRVPTLPKIWVDLAAALTGTDLRTVIEDPTTAMRIVVDAAIAVNADAARLFNLPPRRTVRDHGALIEVDARGRHLGVIDLHGGLATQVDDAGLVNLEDPFRIAFLQFWSTREPLVCNLADAKRISVPEKSFYTELGCCAAQRDVMTAARNRLALIGDCGSATLAFHVLLRRLDNALLDLILDPALVHAVMEKGAAIAIERGKFNIDCGLTVLRLNDSVANMSVISPEHWREFIFPHMRDVCQELHAYKQGVKIYCHICGDVMPILDDLITAGLDCIGPMDPLGGFTCAQARDVVGKRISLMGGVNTLSFVTKTPDDLMEEARTCIEGAGRSGGFVLGSGCALPPTAEKDNLVALSLAAQEYGHYG